jgi:hypothetical protein
MRAKFARFVMYKKQRGKKKNQEKNSEKEK